MTLLGCKWKYLSPPEQHDVSLFLSAKAEFLFNDSATDAQSKSLFSMFKSSRKLRLAASMVEAYNLSRK